MANGVYRLCIIIKQQYAMIQFERECTNLDIVSCSNIIYHGRVHDVFIIM